MENYLPFLVNNWRTVGLIGVSLAAGVALGQLHQTNERTTNKRQQVYSTKSTTEEIKQAKGQSVNENEQVDEDQQIADFENAKHTLFRYQKPSEEDSIKQSEAFYRRMNERRSVRCISSDPVALEVIENIIKTGGMLALSLK